MYICIYTHTHKFTHTLRLGTTVRSHRPSVCVCTHKKDRLGIILNESNARSNIGLFPFIAPRLGFSLSVYLAPFSSIFRGDARTLRQNGFREKNLFPTTLSIPSSTLVKYTLCCWKCKCSFAFEIAKPRVTETHLVQTQSGPWVQSKIEKNWGNFKCDVPRALRS